MYFRNADTRYLHKQHRLWFLPIGFLRLLIMEAAHTLYTPIGELQAEKRTRSSRKQHFFHKSSNKKITGYHKEEFIAINLKILLHMLEKAKSKYPMGLHNIFNNPFKIAY